MAKTVSGNALERISSGIDSACDEFFLSEVSEVRVDVMLRATQARFKCGYERVFAYLHQTR